MNPKKENPKIAKVEEPSVIYESSNIKFKGIDRAAFDFDEEIKNGYTPEEFKAEMHKRIKSISLEKIMFEDNLLDYLDKLVFTLFKKEYFLGCIVILYCLFYLVLNFVPRF